MKKNSIILISIFLIISFIALIFIVNKGKQEKINNCKEECDYSNYSDKGWRYSPKLAEDQKQCIELEGKKICGSGSNKLFETQAQCIDYCLTNGKK